MAATGHTNNCTHCGSGNYKYHIVEKFGGENVWRTYSFQTVGRKKFGE